MLRRRLCFERLESRQMLSGTQTFTNADPVAPLSTTPPPSGMSNLNASDFTYLGAQSLGQYDYFSGLAYRPETNTFFSILGAGQPPFDLVEFSNTGPSGGYNLVKDWGDLDPNNQLLPGATMPQMEGLWWDDANQRLWVSFGDYYNASQANDQVMAYVTLDTGSPVVHGPWGVVASVGSEQVKSEITPAPPELAAITGNKWMMSGGKSNAGQALSWGAGLVSVADPSSLPADSLTSAEQLVNWPMKTGYYENGAVYAPYSDFPSGNNVTYIVGNENASPPTTLSYEYNTLINQGAHFVEGDGLSNYTFIDTGNVEGFIYIGLTGNGYTWYGNYNAHDDTSATGVQYGNDMTSLVHPGQPLVDQVQSRGTHVDQPLLNAYFVNYQDVLNAATAVKNGTATAATLQVAPNSIVSLATLGGAPPVSEIFPVIGSYFDPVTDNLYLLQFTPTSSQLLIWHVDPPAAVSPATASFVAADTNTRGNWQGTYGADGYNVIGDATSYPSYAQVSVSGEQNYVWAGSTGASQALQKETNPSDRIAATWYSPTSFTIDVNLTDGNTHQVALYLLDWDKLGRSERIDVLNAATGAVLDSETASNFSGGEYLRWTLGGHVELRVTSLSGPNAVVSGLFFGQPPAAAPASASFVQGDIVTSGNWQNAYGGDGYNIVGDSASNPGYAQVAVSGQQSYVWAASTTDQRALQKATNPADRIAATWYSPTSFTLDVRLTDGNTHQLSLYLLDWDQLGRSERIDVIDPATGTVLSSQTTSGFGGGEYLTWKISGHVQLRVTSLSGPNAVVSGLFFGNVPDPAPPSASFDQSDRVTSGTWQNVYGAEGYNVIGNAANLPSYAQVTVSGQQSDVWAASTGDGRALQKATDPADRVAATWYSPNSFTINVAMTDGKTHEVSLYLLDWDQLGRSERIDVIDPATGTVLNSQTASQFGNGEYLTWTIGGEVQLRITDLSGANAVVSGLFFGNVTPPASNPATASFVTADATTAGTWQGKYGSAGYDVFDNAASLPTYAQLSASGEQNFVWASSTSDPRALQKAGSSSDRIAATWYAANSFTIDLNFTDGKIHQVAAYLLDWDNGGRSEQVSVLDAATGSTLDTRTLSSFTGGEYLVWNLSGHVQLRFTHVSGINAVLSGLFLD